MWDPGISLRLWDNFLKVVLLPFHNNTILLLDRIDERIMIDHVVSINVLYRKDSFVTHRAFCDALTEENYKLNQNLAATAPGILQSQAQEHFSSSMPASNSCSNTNSMMNLSISDDNIDNSLRPLSLNFSGVMLTNNLDRIFNPKASHACFSLPGGLNSSPLVLSSSYTSATALLQKAAEMGAKISDNSIAPILLRGFTGYSTASMNSSGLVQEASSIVGHSMGPNHATTNGMYLGNQETFNENLNLGDPRPTYTTISQTTGMLESSPFMHSENETPVNLLEGDVMLMRGGEKTTVDFLGVEPAGHSIIGRKRSYNGNIMGSGYSSSQQSLHSEW